ncbi:MAG: glycosyltransferase [Bacteroidia bacterium]
MHIAVLSDPANFHTQKWATALQRVGARVTIFSFSDYQMDDVECVKIPPGFTLNGNITYASYLYSTDKLLKEVKARKVDLLNPLNITPFGVWATRTGFEPVVSVAMGADILEYPPTRKESNIPDSRIWSSNTTQSPGPIGKMVKDVKWRMFRNQVQEALHKSALITGDNIQLVQAIKNWFGIPEHKVKLNRWGIEEELFEVSEIQKQALREKFNIRDWQKVVLSPRGMKPVYQGDLILESFEMLLRRGVRDINMIMLSAGYDVPPKVAQKSK